MKITRGPRASSVIEITNRHQLIMTQVTGGAISDTIYVTPREAPVRFLKRDLIWSAHRVHISAYEDKCYHKSTLFRGNHSRINHGNSSRDHLGA